MFLFFSFHTIQLLSNIQLERFFKPASYARDGSTPLPQIVAHRGYKKLYPENSLAAFKGALEAGSHGIETDLQLTQDGVVIIAHVCCRRIFMCV
jgi:glycerophosphoryl diester phosphodiesterase